MRKKIMMLAMMCMLVILSSCEKADIPFTDNGLEDDPDVVEVDNLAVALGTVKQDTILTSGSGNLLAGTYTDAYFGRISSFTYMEIENPATNPLSGKAVRFDSICLVLKPTGYYKGDTTLPFNLSVHSLQENISNANSSDAYYNTRSFAHHVAPLAQVSAVIKPSLQKEWLIRLPDALGTEWMQKLADNAAEIQSQQSFRSYFKGLLLSTDSNTNKCMYYFTGDSTAVIRLYYKELGLYNVDKALDFHYVAGKTFYHYKYNYTNTSLAGVDPKRRQYFSSSSTGNKAFLSGMVPSAIKFSFPDILTLKERFSNLKIIKAVLEIKPLAGSYHYPASLPATFVLNETNSENYTGAYIPEPGGQAIQYGALVYDPLNSVNTKYSFIITDFINALIEEGQFSTKALLLSQADNSLQQSAQLILNDQSIQKDVKLKVYVLEL